MNKIKIKGNKTLKVKGEKEIYFVVAAPVAKQYLQKALLSKAAIDVLVLAGIEHSRTMTEQYNYVHDVRAEHPDTQFIVMTNSLPVIMGASADAVFYKVEEIRGKVKVSRPLSNITNMMANTLLTSPLFAMNTARTRDSDKNIDTSDDFIYDKIHKAIAKRVKEVPAPSEGIIQWIEEELDKL